MRISVLTPTIRGDEALGRPSSGLQEQSFKDFEWIVERHDPKDPPDFNAAMNRMIRKAKGELIVFLQDFIKPNPEGLQMFWDAYQKNPKAFYTAPVGKTLDGETVTWDWRKSRSNDENLNFMEWEIDWGCAPTRALFEIGGFDEELDKFWGFDNVNIGLRAEQKGFIIRNVKENHAIAYDHNAVIEHPYQKLRNPDFHNGRLAEIMRNQVEVKYL